MIYRKRDSDFELAVHFPNLPKNVHLPFSLYFYNKEGDPEFEATYDGTDYLHCVPTEYGVDVQFEKDCFLSCAEIECQMEFPIPNPNDTKGREDFVEIRATGVEIYDTTTHPKNEANNNEKPNFKPTYAVIYQANDYSQTEEWEVLGEWWADLQGVPKPVFCRSFIGTLKDYQESVELAPDIASAVLITGYISRPPYSVLPGNISLWNGAVTSQALQVCFGIYSGTLTINAASPDMANKPFAVTFKYIKA